MFPKLIEELPEIIQFLDLGEDVSIDRISDEDLRKYLSNLVEYVKLLQVKQLQPCSLASTIINELQICTKRVADLTPGESLAYRSGAPRVLHLIRQYPQLRTEFDAFLESLITQGSVDLSGMENTDVRDELSSFLTSLGLFLDYEEGDEIYSLPQDKGKASVVEECLDHLREVFSYAISHNLIESVGPVDAIMEIVNGENLSTKKHKKDRKLKLKKEKRKKSKHKDKRESKRSRGETRSQETGSKLCLDRDSNSDDESSEEDSFTILAGRKRVLGPILPPSHKSTPNESYNESNDEGAGPLPADSIATVPGQWHDYSGPSFRSDSSLPAPSVYATLSSRNYSSINQQPIENTAIGDYSGGILPASHTGTGVIDDDPTRKEVPPAGREEWMLDIGENKILTDSFGVTRKFQTGKQAKKAAQWFIDAKKRQEQIASTSTPAAEDVGKDDLRGPSLMDVHRERVEAGLVEKKKSQPEEKVRRPFDREQDVLARTKMSSKQVAQLVENARELGSRFDKGSFQRGF